MRHRHGVKQYNETTVSLKFLKTLVLIMVEKARGRTVKSRNSVKQDQ